MKSNCCHTAFPSLWLRRCVWLLSSGEIITLSMSSGGGALNNQPKETCGRAIAGEMKHRLVCGMGGAVMRRFRSIPQIGGVHSALHMEGACLSLVYEGLIGVTK